MEAALASTDASRILSIGQTLMFDLRSDHEAESRQFLAYENTYGMDPVRFRSRRPELHGYHNFTDH